MIKIRLMRIGAKQKPFYRIVVVDERSKRTGAYIELLGTYNPLTEPKDIKLKQDRIDYWIKQGAQPSTGYLRMIGKAPQRPPRKPKKESKQVTGDSGQKEEVKTEESKSEEKPAEETPTSETPAETTEPAAQEQIVEQPTEEATQPVEEKTQSEEPTSTETKEKEKTDERPA